MQIRFFKFCQKVCIFTLITPAPFCANMIQTLVHTCRGLGCSIFIKINVKRQSNPSPLKVFNSQHCSAHIQLSIIISKYHSKKCVPFRHNSQGNRNRNLEVCFTFFVRSADELEDEKMVVEKVF